MALLIGTATAAAVDYEGLGDVGDADELEQLCDAGSIDPETCELLTELHANGVALDDATRDEIYQLPGLTYEDADQIIAYRTTVGPIVEPAELVVAGVLTEGQLESIEPFLAPPLFQPSGPRVKGRVRLRSAWSTVDGLPPTTALQARLAAQELTIGVAAVTTRQRLWDVRWQPEPWFVVDAAGRRGVFTAEAPTLRGHVPKYFASFDRPAWGGILGTYTIGFGQRLTFDSTPRVAPHGYYPDDAVAAPTGMTASCKEAGGELAHGLGPSPCSGERRYDRALTDFGWSEHQRGIALRAATRPGAGDEARFELHLWASELPRSLYQYDLYHTELCADPHRRDDELCRAPEVYKSPVANGEATTRFKQHTLPRLFSERLVGANASYFVQRRTHVGVTAYLADVVWRARQARIDFDPSARYPAGGGFGAAGIDVAWGSGSVDLFLEVARSFTQAPRGGEGTGLVAGAAAAWNQNEVEWSGRYYAESFENPYAGSLAAADEHEGLRVRDELGTRLTWLARSLPLALAWRGRVDLWLQPSTSLPKLVTSLRVDQELTEAFRPGFAVEFRSKDLTRFSRADCYEGEEEDPESSEPVPCGGEKLSLVAHLTVDPVPMLSFAMRYAQAWRDTSLDPRHFAKQRSFELKTTIKSGSRVRFVARGRWYEDHVGHGDRGEQSLAGSSVASLRVAHDLRLELRYEVVEYLDRRASTRQRRINPEHWGRVGIDWRF